MHISGVSCNIPCDDCISKDNYCENALIKHAGYAYDYSKIPRSAKEIAFILPGWSCNPFKVCATFTQYFYFGQFPQYL